jgi:hypothetical protein
VRPQVIELERLGPLPPDDLVVQQNLAEVVREYEQLISSITAPVTDEEARVLVGVLGPGDCFGLEWAMISLIESAPGWPLLDCLGDMDNHWIQFLLQRLRNSGRL